MYFKRHAPAIQNLYYYNYCLTVQLWQMLMKLSGMESRRQICILDAFKLASGEVLSFLLKCKTQLYPTDKKNLQNMLIKYLQVSIMSMFLIWAVFA